MPDEPVLLKPGEGEGTERYTLLADRQELVMTEFRYEPNQDGPRRHIHRHHADAFYCLEGRLRITLDEEDVVLGPGAFVLVPPEVIHAFGNPAGELGRYLNFHAPGCGFGDYLRGDNPDFDQFYDVPPGSGRPTSEAVLRQPGEGEESEREGISARVKAAAGDGMGSLAVYETTAEPGSIGPAPHEHAKAVTGYFVLDGALTVHLGDEHHHAERGSFALIPPGRPHTFSNAGADTARFLTIMAPGEDGAN